MTKRIIFKGYTNRSLVTAISKIIAYTDYLIEISEQFFNKKDFPLATFFAVIAIEERSKILSLLDLIKGSNNPSGDRYIKYFEKDFFNHKNKLSNIFRFMGDLFKAYGERISSKEYLVAAEKFYIISKVAPKGLDNLKQESLYLTPKKRKFVLPKDLVNKNEAELVIEMTKYIQYWINFDREMIKQLVHVK